MTNVVMEFIAKSPPAILILAGVLFGLLCGLSQGIFQSNFFCNWWLALILLGVVLQILWLFFKKMY
jgi:hypothetical protein